MKILVKEDKPFRLEVLAYDETYPVEQALGIKETGVDHSDTIRKVNEQDLLWFSVEFEIYKDEEPVYVESLRCNCYETYYEFITSDSYIGELLELYENLVKKERKKMRNAKTKGFTMKKMIVTCLSAVLLYMLAGCSETKTETVYMSMQTVQ